MFRNIIIRSAAIVLGVLVNFDGQLHAHPNEDDPIIPSLKKIASKKVMDSLELLPEQLSEKQPEPLVVATTLSNIKVPNDVMDLMLAQLPSRVIFQMFVNKSARELIYSEKNLTSLLAKYLPKNVFIESQGCEEQEKWMQVQVGDFGEPLNLSLDEVTAIPCQNITLTPREDWGIDVFESIAKIQSLIGLTIYENPLTASQANALFAAPDSLPSLEYLEFRDSLSIETAHALEVSLPKLQRLRVLKLLELGNQLQDRRCSLANAIFCSDCPPPLEKLTIRFEKPFPAPPSSFFHSLAACKGAKSLTKLDLIDVTMGLEGAKALGKVALEECFPSLTSVSLIDCDLSAESLTALLPFFINLKKIDLTNNYFGDAGVQALAASPHITNVESLSLKRVGMKPTNIGLASILSSSHLKKLCTLSLSQNNLGQEGGRIIGKKLHENLPNVSDLDLSSTGLGSEGIKLMVDKPGVGQLRSLNLYSNDVDEPTLDAIARSHNLKRLQALLIGEVELSVQGLESFLRSSNLSSIETLELFPTVTAPIKELVIRLKEEEIPLAFLPLAPEFCPPLVEQKVEEEVE